MTVTPDARLRAAAARARELGFAAGFPNFHVRGGETGVCGHVFLRDDVAEVHDVRADFLGNPAMRALPGLFRRVHSFARLHGYASAFPNGHEANCFNLGHVFGVTFIRQGMAVVDETFHEAPGDSPDADSDPGHVFRLAADHARRKGFEGGFPTFDIWNRAFNTPAPPFVQYRFVLLKGPGVEWRDVPLADLRF
jgi:hypothetical protein